jgi:hypothetical protein
MFTKHNEDIIYRLWFAIEELNNLISQKTNLKEFFECNHNNLELHLKSVLDLIQNLIKTNNIESHDLFFLEERIFTSLI